MIDPFEMLERPYNLDPSLRISEILHHIGGNLTTDEGKYAQTTIPPRKSSLRSQSSVSQAWDKTTFVYFSVQLFNSNVSCCPSHCDQACEWREEIKCRICVRYNKVNRLSKGRPNRKTGLSVQGDSAGNGWFTSEVLQCTLRLELMQLNSAQISKTKPTSSKLSLCALGQKARSKGAVWMDRKFNRLKPWFRLAQTILG